MPVEHVLQAVHQHTTTAVHLRSLAVPTTSAAGAAPAAPPAPEEGTTP